MQKQMPVGSSNNPMNISLYIYAINITSYEFFSVTRAYSYFTEKTEPWEMRELAPSSNNTSNGNPGIQSLLVI